MVCVDFVSSGESTAIQCNRAVLVVVRVRSPHVCGASKQILKRKTFG